MIGDSIPVLSSFELQEYLYKAAASPRRRHPKILHQSGDGFNQVFNFMMEDTYMQPHLHPSKEKIEQIYLVQGCFAVLIFNKEGDIEKISILEKGRLERIEISAFTWHSYVMLSNNVVTYETMMGKFHPDTWKELADWAPTEQSKESIDYLEFLKRQVKGDLAEW